METITHACLGMLCAVIVARKESARSAAVAGMVAGNLPDLDVLIQSASNPMVHLLYHRHFTHSVVFSPVLMAVGAGIGWMWGKIWSRMSGHRISYSSLLLPSLLAVWSHLFCDLWTSFGIRLWWPFSGRREALNLISVVDPIMTIPLIICCVPALFRSSRRWARRGLGWAVLYLVFCGIQHHRASAALQELAASRGHKPVRQAVMPSFANTLVWRRIYEWDDAYHVDAIRVGLPGQTTVLPGGQLPALAKPRPEAPDWQGLPGGSVAAQDVREFYHFAGEWAVECPANSGDAQQGTIKQVGDLRYALLPNSLDPQWGISFDSRFPEHHAEPQGFARRSGESLKSLWEMVKGSRQ